jgi:hypothetical protein
VDVRDAARAYIACLTADETVIRDQIFKVSYRIFRICELAFRVREALRGGGVSTEIRTNYTYGGVRSYRVRTTKTQHVLGLRAIVSVEDSVRHVVTKIREAGYVDFQNARHYNIRWMKALEEAKRVIRVTGSVFDAPPRSRAQTGKVSVVPRTG